MLAYQQNTITINLFINLFRSKISVIKIVFIRYSYKWLIAFFVSFFLLISSLVLFIILSLAIAETESNAEQASSTFLDLFLVEARGESGPAWYLRFSALMTLPPELSEVNNRSTSVTFGIVDAERDLFRSWTRSL